MRKQAKSSIQTSTNAPGCEWFPRPKMAEIFGINVSLFDRDIRPLVPFQAIRKSGRTVEYHARTVLEQWSSARIARLERADPLLMGSESPALERYRAERAQLARLDRLERERRLLPQTDVRAGLEILVKHLRHAVAELIVQIGAEAGSIVSDATEEIDRAAEQAFNQTPSAQATADNSAQMKPRPVPMRPTRRRHRGK